MAYRSIDENFWRSEKVRPLSDAAKLAYLFLITQGRLTGVVSRLPEELAAGIGWPVKKWLSAVDELARADRVSIGYPALIWIKGHIEHQFLDGGRQLSPKIRAALNKELSSFPKSQVVQRVAEKYKEIFGIGYRYPIDTVSALGVTVPVPEPVPEPVSKDGGRQKAPTGKKVPEGYQFLVDHFHESWEAAKPGLRITWSAVNGDLLKGLMRKQTLEAIMAAWDFYLSSPDFFAQKNGQSFGNFVASFDKTQSRMSGVEARDTRFENLKEI